MLFRPARGIRRYAQDELAFRHAHAFYAGLDSKLHQVVHLRQSFSAKLDLFPGPDGPKEFHAPDRGKKKQRLCAFVVTRSRRDPGRLRERLGQDDARNQWITRKMAGEDRIVRSKRRDSFRQSTRVALDQFTDKNKRRSMRQTEKRPTALERHANIFLCTIRLSARRSAFTKSAFALTR